MTFLAVNFLYQHSANTAAVPISTNWTNKGFEKIMTMNDGQGVTIAPCSILTCQNSHPKTDVERWSVTYSICSEFNELNVIV